MVLSIVTYNVFSIWYFYCWMKEKEQLVQRYLQADCGWLAWESNTISYRLSCPLLSNDQCLCEALFIKNWGGRNQECLHCPVIWPLPCQSCSLRKLPPGHRPEGEQRGGGRSLLWGAGIGHLGGRHRGDHQIGDPGWIRSLQWVCVYRKNLRLIVKRM